jgi:hypothetical protein
MLYEFLFSETTTIDILGQFNLLSVSLIKTLVLIDSTLISSSIKPMTQILTVGATSVKTILPTEIASLATTTSCML